MEEGIRVLDQVRERIRERKNDLSKNPNATAEEKEKITIISNLFNDVDAIAKAPKSTVCILLMMLDYDYEDITKKDGIYNRIYEEATKKYTIVHPDLINNGGLKSK